MSRLTLFYYRYVDHRDLHSFPTRRSSDLAREARVEDRPLWGDHLHRPKDAVVLRHVLGEGDLVRSEEHTSELQSHHDLVCRLLLEKKKSNELEYRRLTCRVHAGST